MMTTPIHGRQGRDQKMMMFPRRHRVDARRLLPVLEGVVQAKRVGVEEAVWSSTTILMSLPTPIAWTIFPTNNRCDSLRGCLPIAKQIVAAVAVAHLAVCNHFVGVEEWSLMVEGCSRTSNNHLNNHLYRG